MRVVRVTHLEYILLEPELVIQKKDHQTALIADGRKALAMMSLSLFFWRGSTDVGEDVSKRLVILILRY
jgi:hypothetical protein